MNRFFYTVLVLLLLLAVGVGVTGCIKGETGDAKGQTQSSSNASDGGETVEGENVFYATVTATESGFGGIEVKPDNNDVLPLELVVHSDDMPKVKVGDRVRVQHGGQITLSLPGQIFGATVTVVE